MKYILKNIKENNRDLEFNIIEKSENHILGEMYEVFGDGKTEPYFYSYITTVNLRYEGIITMNYGKRNKEEIRVSGPNGMLTHMRIQGFLAQIALIESKGRKYYTASFKDVINTGILDGFEVEFLENENFKALVVDVQNHLVQPLLPKHYSHFYYLSHDNSYH